MLTLISNFESPIKRLLSIDLFCLFADWIQFQNYSNIIKPKFRNSSKTYEGIKRSSIELRA